MNAGRLQFGVLMERPFHCGIDDGVLHLAFQLPERMKLAVFLEIFPRAGVYQREDPVERAHVDTALAGVEDVDSGIAADMGGSPGPDGGCVWRGASHGQSAPRYQPMPPAL